MEDTSAIVECQVKAFGSISIISEMSRLSRVNREGRIHDRTRNFGPNAGVIAITQTVSPGWNLQVEISLPGTG
jgi:hypothetical protein